MTIVDAIRILRQVHERHGNLEIVDDNHKEIVGITMDRPTMIERMAGDSPRCLISVKRRE